MTEVLMIIRSIVMLVLAVSAGSAAAQNSPELKSPKEKHSYAVGMDLGNQLRNISFGLEDVDPDIIARGVKDAMSGGGTLLTAEELKANIAEMQAEMKKRKLLSAKPGPGVSSSAGGFLAENAKKEGVVTLPSGLQYKILREGKGQKPTIKANVLCHYRGTLTDGTEFDSSYARNQPALFAVSGVIPGWTEALQLMPVGSKWQLFIPPHLAYGWRGFGTKIGPNETLIFELELLEIK